MTRQHIIDQRKVVALAYDDPDQVYEAGQCNIGPAEIARRRRAGYAGLAAAVGVTLFLILIAAPPITRLAVALPLAVGFSGLIQAHLRFCANYGWRGIRNLGAIGEAERVDDGRDRALDRTRSLQIFALAGTTALVVATALALLPL